MFGHLRLCICLSVCVSVRLPVSVRCSLSPWIHVDWCVTMVFCTYRLERLVNVLRRKIKGLGSSEDYTVWWRHDTREMERCRSYSHHESSTTFLVAECFLSCTTIRHLLPLLIISEIYCRYIRLFLRWLCKWCRSVQKYCSKKIVSLAIQHNGPRFLLWKFWSYNFTRLISFECVVCRYT